MAQSLTTPQTQLKAYKTIDPNSGNIATIKLDPDQQAHKDPKAFAIISMLIANASGKEAQSKVETSMLALAMQANKVTVQEAMSAFWRAYGDPYVAGGRIEFRHLMKYIEQDRETSKVQLFTYSQMLNLVSSGKNIMSDFECLNGENNLPDVRDPETKKPYFRMKLITVNL